MTVICVNGIRTDGRGSTDLMVRALLSRDVPAFDCNYETVWAIMTRFRFARRRVADAIMRSAASLSPPYDVVAHSFGCLGTLEAMKVYGFEPRHIFFFGAAVDCDFPLAPLAFNSLTNVCNAADKALRAATLLPWHPMGAMGRTGWVGNDRRVANIKWRDRDQGVDDDWFDHSDYFRSSHLSRWADLVADRVRGS